MEEGDFSALKQILSTEDIASIPFEASRKLEKYFNEKFQEFVTAKALFQTNRKNADQKLESLSKQLEFYQFELKDSQKNLGSVEKYASELQSQLIENKNEIARLHLSVSRLEKDTFDLRKRKDVANDQNDLLHAQIERRNSELDRLKMEMASLMSQLENAIAGKCHVLAEMEEIKSRELSLDFRESRFEKEHSILNQQVKSLEDELSERINELANIRIEASTRNLLVESRLAQCEEELKNTNEIVLQLRESNSILQRHCDDLTQKLEDQRNQELSMHASYSEEIVAQTRLAQLHKGIADEASMKAAEFGNTVKDLQDVINETTEQYGILETKYNDLLKKHDVELLHKERRINELVTELENANEMLKSVKQGTLDQAIAELAPSAALASKILNKGLSLTQMYTLLIQATNELTLEKEENEKLKSQMEIIVREIEEKAPLIQQQQEEFQDAVLNVNTLTIKLDEVLLDNIRLQEDLEESKKLVNVRTSENDKMKTEVSDLARQVCYLLKEIQNYRLECKFKEKQQSDSDVDMSSSQLISKKLVTFKHIEELQENNQRLLSLVRNLSVMQNESEKIVDNIDAGDTKQKLHRYLHQLNEMQSAQERQNKMVDGLLKQRDMYRFMYQQIINKDFSQSSKIMHCTLKTGVNEKINHENEKPSSSDDNNKKNIIEKNVKYDLICEEFENYKTEKSLNEKMLNQEIDRLRKENEKLSMQSCRLKVELDATNERFNLLQTTVTSCKSQIKSLENKCSVYNSTIVKHEHNLMTLKDEALNSQAKLSRAEVQLENLRQEKQILQHAEARLTKEREILQRERQTQFVLKADVEVIKASLERVQAEGNLRAEQRLDDAIRECSALRRRFHEEQDRSRESLALLERQLTSKVDALNEEKKITQRLEEEINAYRILHQENVKKIEELNNKIKQTSTCSSKTKSGTDELQKKIKDLELRFINSQIEIKSLTEQLKAARCQGQQYCDIAESAETQMKELSAALEKSKVQIEAKEKAALEDRTVLQEKISRLEEQLSKVGDSRSVIDTESSENDIEGAESLKELHVYKEENENLKNMLQAASEASSATEEKYAKAMMQHSIDLQVLAQVKEEMRLKSGDLLKLTKERDMLKESLEIEKLTWKKSEESLERQLFESQRRIEDLDAQNLILHNQIQELSDRSSLLFSSKSTNLIADDTDISSEHIHESFHEEDSKSPEQLLKVMKYVRREKDLIVAKFDVIRAENIRLKSQLEIAEKRLENLKCQVSLQKEKTEIEVVTASRHAELLRKVETMNAITDSNRALREEKDALSLSLNEIKEKYQTLSEEVIPLREKLKDSEMKLEILLQDNASLKGESSRWRNRANVLVERVNKASPEDWRRLQTERENLSKLLTSEREAHSDQVREFEAMKKEKSRIDLEVNDLLRKVECAETEKSRITQELHKLSQNLNEYVSEFKTKEQTILNLQKELSLKETTLNEIKNKEIQIRKIAKKYKTQYEELSRTLEKEKFMNKDVAVESDNNETVATANLTTDREHHLREKSHQELVHSNEVLVSRVQELSQQLLTMQQESEHLKKEVDIMGKEGIAKEERAKLVLKNARTKIVQLTEYKKVCDKELTELKSKIDVSTSDPDSSEIEAKFHALLSQTEGKINRLEHEKNELQTEKEALLQRVSQLQRQLANIGGASLLGEPPTANIKPMSARTETPLASIRPMSVAVQARTAAILPTTAPSAVLVSPHIQQQQIVHTTDSSSPTSSHSDYQSASTSSSSHVQGNLRQLIVQPQINDSAESTQREESEIIETVSMQPQQLCQQQTVALVSPRVEQQQQSTGEQMQNIASSSSQSVSTTHATNGQKRTRNMEMSSSLACLSDGTDQTRQDLACSPKSKRSRKELIQVAVGISDIEYQVPTSSQRDQDDDTETTAGTICEDLVSIRNVDEEEFDNETYADVGDEDELPYENVELDNNEVETLTQDSSTNAVGQRQEHHLQQSETISSAGHSREQAASRLPRNVSTLTRTQNQHLTLVQQGYDDNGDDCIVPSTPTLFVPRRNDGFGEAISSPQAPQIRFSFNEQALPTPCEETISEISENISKSIFASASSALLPVVPGSTDEMRVDLTQIDNLDLESNVVKATIGCSQLDNPIQKCVTDIDQRDDSVKTSIESLAPAENRIDLPASSSVTLESSSSEIVEKLQPPSQSDSQKAGIEVIASGEEDILESDAVTDDDSNAPVQVESKNENDDLDGSSTLPKNATSSMLSRGSAIPTINTSTARRSMRTAYRTARASRPTPIVWDNQQAVIRGGSSLRVHSPRNASNDGIRSRGTRGRRIRSKYPYNF